MKYDTALLLNICSKIFRNKEWNKNQQPWDQKTMRVHTCTHIQTVMSCLHCLVFLSYSPVHFSWKLLLAQITHLVWKWTFSAYIRHWLSFLRHFLQVTGVTHCVKRSFLFYLYIVIDLGVQVWCSCVLAQVWEGSRRGSCARQGGGLLLHTWSLSREHQSVPVKHFRGFEFSSSSDAEWFYGAI